MSDPILDKLDGILRCHEMASSDDNRESTDGIGCSTDHLRGALLELLAEAVMEYAIPEAEDRAAIEQEIRKRFGVTPSEDEKT